jgi:hypothetical protein
MQLRNILLLTLGLAFILAACGVRGDPKPIDPLTKDQEEAQQE